MRQHIALRLFSIIVVCACTILWLGTTNAYALTVSETMTDRCSGDVAFVPSYDARPDAPGTVVITRADSAWSRPLKVQTGDGGRIRWWCHSTTGNFLDPGTWRPDIDKGKLAACAAGGIAYIIGSDAAAKKGLEQCQGVVQTINSSAWSGWTPERSRCSDRSTLIRARLDADRLLQTQCLKG